MRDTGVLPVLGSTDDVAHIEPRAKPAVEVDLHAAAVVERGVDVVAENDDVGANTHRSVSRQDERGHRVERQLRNRVTAEAVHEREVVGDASDPSGVGRELALDPEHPQREVAQPQTDVGRHGPQRFLWLCRRIVEVVVGVGEIGRASCRERV